MSWVLGLLFNCMSVIIKMYKDVCFIPVKRAGWIECEVVDQIGAGLAQDGWNIQSSWC